MKNKKFDFSSAIKKLEDINQWFHEEEIDLDEGLKKIREGKQIIKDCRDRLKDVENEFIKIQKEDISEEQPEIKPEAEPDMSEETPF